MLSKKHIKVPKTYEPGGGHPTEHLAYMSKAEMEMLRLLTDGVVARGPKGIPSFVLGDANTRGTAANSAMRSAAQSNARPSTAARPNSGPTSAPVRTQPSAAARPSANVNRPSDSGGSRPSGPSSSPSSANVNRPSDSGGSRPAASVSARPSGAPAAPAASAAAAKAAGAARVGAQTAQRPPAASPAPSRAPGVGTSSRGPNPAAAAAANRLAAMPSFTPPTPPRGPNAAAAAAAQKADERQAAAAVNQKNAYVQFGQRMAQAPRLPSVPRAPGDAERMARMAMAESGIIRDETGNMNPVGAQAVMSVIRNRMLNQDETVGGIIGQSGQFSPWGDGKYSKTKADPAYTALAEQILRGNVGDVTKGADFYHNRSTVKGGYSTASDTTKDRIDNNFRPTFSVDDYSRPGVYGHQFGVAADGSKATPMRMSRQRVARGGIADPRDPARAIDLPAGALDPNWTGGGMATGDNARRVPGRFGSSIPGERNAPVDRISTGPGQPVETYGAISEPNRYAHRFEDSAVYADQSTLRGLPSQFSTRINPTGLYNQGVPVDNWNRNARGRQFDPNNLTPDAQRAYQGLVDTALRTGEYGLDFFSGTDMRGRNHVGHAMDMRLVDPATGQPVGGISNPIGSVRPFFRSPARAAAIREAIGPAYDGFANDVMDTLYQNPSVYGGIAPRTRYGGDFRDGKSAYDYMHYDVTPGGGFSGPQAQRHRQAVARANGADEGGFQTADTRGAVSMSNEAAPPSGPGYLQRGAQAFGGFLRGDYRLPGKESLHIPGYKQAVDAYMPAYNMGGFVRAGADKAASALYGDQIRQGFADALAGAQNWARGLGTPPRSPDGGGETGPGGGDLYRPARTEASTTKDRPRSRRRGQPNFRDTTNGRDAPAPRRRIAFPAAGTAAPEPVPPAVAPVDMSYFTNVMSREEALRRLLGEEWSA